MDETLPESSQQTTIHGGKHLANRSTPLAHRKYWNIIFTISILLLGNFVSKIGRRLLENEVILIDESKPIKVYEIPFPAVTVCSEIKFKKDKFDLKNIPDRKLIVNEEPADYEKKFAIAEQVCRREFIQKVADNLGYVSRHIKTDFDWMDMLQKMSPSFEDVFGTCGWVDWVLKNYTMINPTKQNCERLFSMVLTHEGICFTFNSIRDILRTDSLQSDFPYHNITRGHDGWDPEKGYTKADAYPYKGIVKADRFATSGLKFVLNANRSDMTPLCLDPNVGYKITLHSPTEYPQAYENFIPLEFGKDYQIAAVPKTIKTAEDLRSVTPEKRRCYFNDERKLKFYTFYNEHNCRLECYANYILDHIGGVPISSPRNSNTTNEFLPYYNYGRDYPELIDLTNSHFAEFGGPQTHEDVTFYRKCNCLPECNSIHYDYKILKSNDESVIYSNGLVQTTIEIIFNKPTFIGQQRVRKYTFDIMVSNFGGLLGLFIGGSLLLFGLYYVCVTRNCGKSNVVQGEN